ncbi:DDE Tnp4 domain-containing protein [Mycena sanguinolenta]|uniref:DDE Tnp4 domain-containing protein n=1 Tax=Mycena sanguinolenta TaxID=230812 RepID=A0A8H6YS90_9AGAR|nr:DDE Tnp4 domain-containing protein [Mycena sanguinolenta]
MPRQTDRQWTTDVALELVTALRLLETITDDSMNKDLFEDSSGSDTDTDSDNAIIHDAPLSTRLIGALADLHSERYLTERQDINKTTEIVNLLLGSWKVNRPEIFRDYLRITPAAFDKLLDGVKDDPIFSNNSDTAEQLPVQHQLAIALYRFGHYGNGASVRLTALLFGVGYGTVPKSTNRVILALCRDRFRRSAIRWPEDGSEAKEAAKAWVERQDRSCPQWRDGWVMVDGTLVPLYARPAHFGNSWFDRKSNYSLNVQIINTPDLRIVDYGVGLPGSQHDASAWKKTRIPREHETLLPNDEWCWADSAYPIQKYLVAPYKKPEKDEGRNPEFNYALSGIRIRSEHAVGYLKGRFPSLKGLRLRIDNKDHQLFATLWVVACMVEGRRIMAEDRRGNEAPDEDDADMDSIMKADARDIELLEAQIKREKLKKALFDFYEQQRDAEEDENSDGV